MNQTPAPEQLLRDYLPLVRAEARRLAACRRDWEDDLRSAGTWALWKAAQAYEPGRAKTFAAYVRYKVRNAMIDEMRRISPQARRDVQWARRRAAVETELMQSLRREPTADEVNAAMFGEGRRRQRDHKWRRGRSWVSLDQPVGLDGKATLGNLIADEAPRPGESIESAELSEQARRLIETLEPTMRRVMEMRWRGLKLKVIAAELGLTESRICQLVASACEILRARFRQAA